MTSNNHVQAEALAAWAEGRLAAAEAATVEAHLAGCALCQETLAVFARTELQDVEPGFSRISRERSGFSWFRWRWAVPVAAAATSASLKASAAITPPTDADELLGRVEELSEDELDRLLAERMRAD